MSSEEKVLRELEDVRNNLSKNNADLTLLLKKIDRIETKLERIEIRQIEEKAKEVEQRIAKISENR